MKLTILSGGAAQGLVGALAAAFKAQSGCEIDGTFGAVGAMRDKLLSGTAADLLILTRALIDELGVQGHVVAGSATNIGTVLTAVAVRSGEPSPDVGNAAGLRAALLAADAIYFPDPAKATAGIHFAGVLGKPTLLFYLAANPPFHYWVPGPDGRCLATSSEDMTARLWDAAAGTALGEPLRHEHAVSAAAFSPDGRLLAASLASGDVTVRTTNDWKVVRSFRHAGGATSLAFSPDSKLLYTAGYDGRVHVWDLRTGSQKAESKVASGTIWSVDISPDGRWLAAGGEDKTVRLVPLGQSGVHSKALRGHDRNVWEVRFSPRGDQLASGSFDETARLWSANGKPQKVLTGHSQAVVSLGYSPDGNLLATSGDDSTIRFWRSGVTSSTRATPRWKKSSWPAPAAAAR